MAKTDRSGKLQYGVLPYRINPSGDAEVLLLTSRGSGRWIIPKGWPMKGHKPHIVAATEAHEEAGISGILSPDAVGVFPYTKVMDDREERLCECMVYLMLVTSELPDWPEREQRRRMWFPRRQAAELVEEGSLALMIRTLLLLPDPRFRSATTLSPVSNGRAGIRGKPLVRW